jgi:hypothetical protein
MSDYYYLLQEGQILCVFYWREEVMDPTHIPHTVIHQYVYEEVNSWKVFSKFCFHAELHKTFQAVNIYKALN